MQAKHGGQLTTQLQIRFLAAPLNIANNLLHCITTKRQLQLERHHLKTREHFLQRPVCPDQAKPTITLSCQIQTACQRHTSWQHLCLDAIARDLQSFSWSFNQLRLGQRNQPCRQRSLAGRHHAPSCHLRSIALGQPIATRHPDLLFCPHRHHAPLGLHQVGLASHLLKGLQQSLSP